MIFKASSSFKNPLLILNINIFQIVCLLNMFVVDVADVWGAGLERTLYLAWSEVGKKLVLKAFKGAIAWAQSLSLLEVKGERHFMQKVQYVILVYLGNCEWFGIFVEEFESLLLMFERTVIINVKGPGLKSFSGIAK